MSLFNRSALLDYLGPFQEDWQRKDRCRWAQLYLEGLLQPAVGRKTIEAIARVTAAELNLPASNLRQALQNFIHESPWDERRLLRRYRQDLRERWPGIGTLVVEDISFLKQGSHSVGVHRQVCPERRRKLNCQIVVSVFLVQGDSVHPLAARLYLPYAWHESPSRQKAARVPLAYRSPLSRASIALGLLDGLIAEGFGGQALAVGASYQHSRALWEELRRRAWWPPPHFDPGGARGMGAGGVRPHDAVKRAIDELKQDFGLDHFEGRSWRGLHHHLCLVFLAYDFCQRCAAGAMRV